MYEFKRPQIFSMTTWTNHKRVWRNCTYMELLFEGLCTPINNIQLKHSNCLIPSLHKYLDNRHIIKYLIVILHVEEDLVNLR